MCKAHIVSSIIGSFLLLFVQFSSAQERLDLLEFPAEPSSLANQSILMSAISYKDSILVVGERGHILTWKNNDSWQQHQVPVSVTITAITTLSDGSKIAVGHDGVILKSSPNSEQWQTVFTGYELNNLQLKVLNQQAEQLQQRIAKTVNSDEKEEFEYQLEELTFSIEDAQAQQAIGPNQPFLTITHTSEDILFVAGAYGALLISKDKGISWQLISDRLENPDKFHLNSIISTEKDELFIVGENGLGFISIDLGHHWSVMPMPYFGSLFGIISHEDSTENTQLVAFGLQGNVMVSLDKGQHWQHQKLSSSASLLAGSYLTNGRAVLVGHGGLIVDFNPLEPSNIHYQKHPSGAAFSSIVEKDNVLILAGQFGINFWQLK